MQAFRRFAAAALLLTLTAPGWARPDQPTQVIQSNFNASLVVEEPARMADRLSEMAAQHHATVTNFNMDVNSSNGSASLRLEPRYLPGFIKDVSKLGRIESQNMSTSDYTQSYRDAAERLRIYQNLAEVSMDGLLADTKLSATDRAIARGEMQQLIRERIQSHQSSMNSYMDYNRNAQISLSFRYVPAEAAPKPGQTPPEQVRTAPPPPPPAKGVDHGTLLPLYLLGFVNLTFLWLIARRVLNQSAPAPTPGTVD